MANGMTGLFVMPTAKEALVKGYLATIGNYEIYMDQNVAAGPVNTTGHNSTIAMKVNTNASNSSGSGNQVSTYGMDNTSTGSGIAIGEVFTIAGVNNINPQSRLSTGVLKNFVVTATSFTTISTIVLTFSPPIVTSGPYQNVDSAIAASSAITWLTGTSGTQIGGPQNLAFCRDALGLVMVPMEIPQGVDFAARENYRNISMIVIRAYDINNDVFPTRIDILYGTAIYYDELAVRLGG
jgi:hypothetical protein